MSNTIDTSIGILTISASENLAQKVTTTTTSPPVTPKRPPQEMSTSHPCDSSQLPSTVQFIDRLISQLSDCTTPRTEGNGTAAVPHQPPRPSQTPTSAFHTATLAQLKPLMLTLHCIFPNELLLALDLLDRGFVRRLVRKHDNQVPCSNAPEIPIQSQRQGQAPEAQVQDFGITTPSPPPQEPREDLFFVLSASSSSSSSKITPSSPSPSSFPAGESPNPKGYEVRLHAWNCTCPGFTIAAFRNRGPEPADIDLDLNVASPLDIDIEMGNAADVHLSPNAPPYSFGGTLTSASIKASPPACKHILAALLAALCPGLAGENSRCRPVSVEELAGLCAG